MRTEPPTKCFKFSFLNLRFDYNVLTLVMPSAILAMGLFNFI